MVNSDNADHSIFFSSLYKRPLFVRYCSISTQYQYQYQYQYQLNSTQLNSTQYQLNINSISYTYKNATNTFCMKLNQISTYTFLFGIGQPIANVSMHYEIKYHLILTSMYCILLFLLIIDAYVNIS